MNAATEPTTSRLGVALSMLTLVRGGMGGSETYARALTEQLADRDDVDASVFLTEASRGFSRGIPEEIVPGVHAGGSTVDRLRTVAGLQLHARSIRRRFDAFDVVHYPFTVPAPKPGPRQATVQSLLDIQHLELPELFSRAELQYRKPFYEGFARRADAIVTISQFAKDGMVERLGLDPERIFVAYLGVDTTRFVPYDGPRENFVLYPARGWPHKNHARLFEAMKIARRTNPELTLVLTGGGLDTLTDVPEFADRRGLVSDEELRDLYGRAGAMVFPSLYEGFGLPPLEAMASGCPVATSDSGSLPEVVGDAAVVFDPRDPDAIAAGILSALDRSDELSAAGVEHARSFTWERCRDVHLEAYRFAHEHRR
ncbi:glycosyltransferase family 1 protein [uncultured Leifsonia sp.]|uniref:glycosyltransferase family 4 protein n=1 Tax=uncultured Leifsonia sp. TaxID=340359 RepID=UPI0025E52A5C|nr:glycosyltransferase family 1 protein [uncultured Leifsonia sp.]